MAQSDQVNKVLKMFPGAVLLSEATPEQLDELQERIQKRRGNTVSPIRRKEADSRLLDAWADFLEPHFANGHSTHFTGTYSDSYGYSHGLMLVRNVMRDFVAFRRTLLKHGMPTCPGCIGVEYHPSGRSILHLHALLGGS